MMALTKFIIGLILFILTLEVEAAHHVPAKSRIIENIQKEKMKTKFRSIPNQINDQPSDDPLDQCEDELTIFMSMNSDETETFFLDLDQYFPYNNFTIISVDLIGDDLEQQNQCQPLHFGDSEQSANRLCAVASIPQNIEFMFQNAIVNEQVIQINVTNNPETKEKINETCPPDGISMIASKAPEDQPVHIFLSSNNELYVIIFDDTQHPVSEVANYSENLNSLVGADEQLVCMDIEVYDSTSQVSSSFSKKREGLRDDPLDDTDCLVYIDCNIIKQGQDNEQNFVMIFVPLQKDENDIIKTIGQISVNRYTISNQAASDYFYNCPRRVMNNFSSTLIIYCLDQSTTNPPPPQSNLLFLKNLQNGIAFPNANDIVFVDQSKLQRSGCQDDDSISIYIKSLVSNPLYQPLEQFNILYQQWEFALLLSDRICKCILIPIDSSITCSSIQLSDDADHPYHEMVYIQEENVLTLFVGSNASIDEIQVGESMNEDGQNLIVGSLGIEESLLVLTKITVNSEYIMAQMKNTTYTQSTNGDIDVVVKIFSRTTENTFMHFYQQLESPIELYQNDNFYDMGNYIMIYSPMLCALNVTRVTQKPIVISTSKIDGQNLKKIYTQVYKITGSYSVMNSNLEYKTVQIDNTCLILELVPFSQQVLNPKYTISLNSTWQQQMINLSIKRGVTGSLLYFTYEPNVQNDKFQSLIDYNQTITVNGNFFVNKTIFFLSLNDTNKLYNPVNYRVIVSDYDTPCVVEQYYCEIKNFQGNYYTGNECNQTVYEDLTKLLNPGEACQLDTFSQGTDLIFLGDKSQRLGFACTSIQNKLGQLDEYKCYRIQGDFVNSEVLQDATGSLQGYNQVDFYSYSGLTILITVTADSKKLLLFVVLESYDINDNLDGYCSELFLIVDQTKLSSLVTGTILQMDSYFIEEDYLFLMTSDLKIYVLTRIQQLYIQKSSEDCPQNVQKKTGEKNILQQAVEPEDNVPNTERLVHVSAMIDLSLSQSTLNKNCQSTTNQQFFTLFGVDKNTISLVVLCYNTFYYLMQEFVFQNPFNLNWTRVFPFFNYQVDSLAPHFTDRSIIYISTHYQLRQGTMKAYLMYSIYDFTPNSAVFEVVTCYPTQDPNSFVLLDCDTAPTKVPLNKKFAKESSTPFSYSQYSQKYSTNSLPSVMGIPFNNNRQKTITLALFSFNNMTIINYLNYQPQLYANANLGTEVIAEINLNMIISKINLRDINFNQYSINFDLTDSEIQTLGEDEYVITLANTKTEQNVYILNYQFPITSIEGPIESYEIQLYKDNNIVSVNDQVSNYNSFFGDYLMLEKYYYTYLETYFSYGIVQDILSFSSYQFTPNPQAPVEENCDDCVNLIAVISTKYLILIERDSFKQGIITPVTNIVYKIDLPTLDKQTSETNDGACRMTLNSNSQILVFCVSNQKSTSFKLYQIQYSQANPSLTKVTSRVISSTGGYIGYVDQIIPFDYGNQVYLVIKSHYILNQQMSVFKMAVIQCGQQPISQQGKHRQPKTDSSGSDCSLQVKQTFPANKFQLSDTYIVDYEVQLMTNSNESTDQEVVGLFLSNTTLNVLFFDYIEGQFTVTKNLTLNQTQLYTITNITESEDYNLIFIKLLNIDSTDIFSFLLGTSLNLYEIQYTNGQGTLLYTYGKYYQCEHTPGIKPVIFNMNGLPFNRKTNFVFNPNAQSPSTNNNFLIQSVLSSCSRIPSSQRPVFDPDPSIFSKESSSMYYIQYFIKNKTDLSWPVRILTFPYSTKIKPYIFEGFSNTAGESRIIISNYSYFLVEHQVYYNLNLNLTLTKDSANTLVVSMINGFTQKQINFTMNYDDVLPGSKNKVWFIVLIVVISVIAIIALVFIILWIKKQRNIKQEKKNKDKNFLSSGLTDLTDHKSETNENVRHHHAPSKLFVGYNNHNHHNNNHHLQQIQEEVAHRPSDLQFLNDGKKSLKYNRLSMQVDNLLRSVSMMQRRNNTGEHNTTENNFLGEDDDELEDEQLQQLEEEEEEIQLNK